MLRQPATTGMPETARRGAMACCDAVGEDELHALVECQRKRGGCDLLERTGEEGVGIFVFVPGKDAGAGAAGHGAEGLVDAAFFEGGAEDERVATGRKCPGEEALGLARGYAEEVL